MTDPRPLAGQPNSAVALALGMALSGRPERTHPGALASIVDELTWRGLMPEITSALGQEMTRALMLRVGVDRSRARKAAQESAAQDHEDSQVV